MNEDMHRSAIALKKTWPRTRTGVWVRAAVAVTDATRDHTTHNLLYSVSSVVLFWIHQTCVDGNTCEHD